MYSFTNDYSEGAHSNILKSLMETNLNQETGYGEDRYSQQASELIKEKIGRNDLDIHFISGGTQTNLIAISAFLRPHEAAISVSTGHILGHETGAIEATGHKVISINGNDGKLNPTLLKGVLESYPDEHMVKPKLVYISNSTEIGTIYQKRELEQLSKFCQENKLILYMDGARLGSALTSPESDLELSDLATYLDAFYIGGTKNGALLGEALVICRDSLKEDFRYFIKQKGALLAKGRVLGIQFLELFRESLYFDLARHANAMASLLHKALSDAGFEFLSPSSTNQIFPILPNSLIAELQKEYSFSIWEKISPNLSAVRLVTSWATKGEEVSAFIALLQKLIERS
jgi:threonine aldolase